MSQAAEEPATVKPNPHDIECDVFQNFDSSEVAHVTAEVAAEEIMRRPVIADEHRPTLFDGLPFIVKGHSAPIG